MMSRVIKSMAVVPPSVPNRIASPAFQMQHISAKYRLTGKKNHSYTFAR
jgi:hypothetical protein